MGKARKPTLKDMVKDPWFKTRPRAVQEKIMHYPPGRYLLKPTGQKVVIRAYSEGEDGSCATCTVYVFGKDNPGLLFDRTVFDVPFTDLEPVETI